MKKDLRSKSEGWRNCREIQKITKSGGNSISGCMKVLTR